LSNSPQAPIDYVLGYSELEQNRLVKQAGILRGWTERFFKTGGLAPGMRVLDVGCGMGDVSLLAADIVGPSGTVLGIDRDAAALARAKERASQQGYSGRVAFEQVNLDEFRTDRKFDAAVGRYVLLYQAHPASALRHISAQVKAGGLLIVHELDFGAPAETWPDAPLWSRTYRIMGEAFRRGGNPPDFGKRLARTFLDAGLPWPTIQAEIPIGGEPGSYLFGWVADIVHSLIPRIEQFGLATADELQVDTLAARIEAEAISLGVQLLGPTQFGAWLTIP
jgi:ubiquinone/menaquinone biosynthesis C-methylase UbiE